MTKVTLSGIGLAERNLVKNVLDRQKVITPTIAYRVKRLRNKFKLRAMRTMITTLIEEKKERLVESGIPEKMLQNIGLSWEELLEEGYHQDVPDGEIIYGQELDCDKNDVEWLKSEMEQIDAWVKDNDGEAQTVESAMVETIANLYKAMERVLIKDK